MRRVVMVKTFFVLSLAAMSWGCQILGGLSDDLNLAGGGESGGGGAGGDTGLPPRDPLIWEAGDPGPEFFYTMPEWLPFVSFTDGTTSQIGPHALRLGYLKNQPRAHNVGKGWGLLLEPKRTNYLPHSDWQTGWAAGSGPNGQMELAGGGVDDPGGGAGAIRVNSMGNQQSMVFDAAAGVASTWIRASAAKDPAAYLAYGSSYTAVSGTIGVWSPFSVPRSIMDSDDRYRLETQAMGMDPAITDMTGLDLFGAQVEDGVYPTSFIPTNGAAVTREPDRVTMYTAALAPSGYFDVTIRFAPHYSSETQSIDHDILAIRSDNVYVRLRPPGRAILLTPDLAENVELPGLTWDANEQIEMHARYLPNLREISVSGTKTGSGMASKAGPVPKIVKDDVAWILSNNDGPQEAVDLRSLEVR